MHGVDDIARDDRKTRWIHLTRWVWTQVAGKELATWHMAVSMPMGHDWGVRANDRQVRSCRNEGFGGFGEFEFTQEA